MNTNRFLLAVSFFILCAFAMPALGADAANGVTVKGKELYTIHGEQLDRLKQDLKLPFDVEVSTNGTFKVGDGKERQIEEGQIVRNDGWLLNPDGSIQPVFDHVAMKTGRVYVVRDGKSTAISDTMVFSNGMSTTPDGYLANSYGGRLRLQDGELLRLDGTQIKAMDTVSLKDGRVVVSKAGTLIQLAPVAIMGLSDGTRVRGDGTIWKRDGTTFQLHEGQTILVDGLNYGR